MPINVTRSSMPSFEEYCDEIRKEGVRVIVVPVD